MNVDGADGIALKVLALLGVDCVWFLCFTVEHAELAVGVPDQDQFIGESNARWLAAVDLSIYGELLADLLEVELLTQPVLLYCVSVQALTRDL